jgi:hypothetical protein
MVRGKSDSYLDRFLGIAIEISPEEARKASLVLASTVAANEPDTQSHPVVLKEILMQLDLLDRLTDTQEETS